MAGLDLIGAVAESTGREAVSGSVARTAVHKSATWAMICFCNTTSLVWGPPTFKVSYLDPKAHTDALLSRMAAKLSLLKRDMGKGTSSSPIGLMLLLEVPLLEGRLPFPGAPPSPQPISPHNSLANELGPIILLRPVVKGD